MRTTLIAGLAATALLGLTGPATALTADPTTTPTTEPDTATTTRERGVVLECSGEADGLSAYASLYENDRFGNVLQVILDEDPTRAASREPADILRHGKVGTWITIDGERARIRGAAHAVGRRTPVHEVHDDAGYQIVVDGTHRRLRTDLVLTYAGTRVPLTCDPAFRYDLQVTRTPVV